ncbi:hypothetical protein RB595_002066 [Gaeumannomyces hyphopodioides]
MPTMLGLTNKASSPKPKEEKKKLDTIQRRNVNDALTMETLLWRAMCDDPASAGEYVADDCVMLSPVSFGTDDIMEGKDDIVQALGDGEKWAGFKIQDDKQVAKAGLMAMSVLYKVALFRQTSKGPEQVDAMAHSTWRQSAGADWFLVSHLVAFAD